MNRRLLTLLTPVLMLLLTALACNIRLPGSRAVSITTVTPLPTRAKSLLTPTPNALGGQATVRKPVVNVRKSPNGPALGTLKAGDQVIVLECKDDWCQISKPIKGYIFRGCLSDNPEGLGCEAK